VSNAVLFKVTVESEPWFFLPVCAGYAQPAYEIPNFDIPQTGTLDCKTALNSGSVCGPIDYGQLCVTPTVTVTLKPTNANGSLPWVLSFTLNKNCQTTCDITVGGEGSPECSAGCDWGNYNADMYRIWLCGVSASDDPKDRDSDKQLLAHLSNMRAAANFGDAYTKQPTIN